jgi:hypothetical protein
MVSRLLALAFAVGLSLTARAEVIDFEDLVLGECCNVPPADYHGFTWGGDAGGSSWVFGADAQVGGPDFPGTLTHSGTNYTWSNDGSGLELIRATRFDADGFWVRAGHSPVGFDVEGYRGGQLVHTLHVEAGLDYAQVALGFHDIDRLWFTPQQTSILIDDFAFTPLAAVPEAGSSALLLLGLAAAAVRRRARG